jgi:adenine-specific DNA-methyltransferase
MLNYKRVILDNVAKSQLSLPVPGPTPIARRARVRQFGAVYTPQFLAEWVAGELLRRVRKPAGEKILVLDPACGDGALLSAVRDSAGPRCEVAGFDIDPAALNASARRLGPKAQLTPLDTLMADYRSKLQRTPDAVIVNPPWGADLGYDRPTLQRAGYSLARGQFDTYELFIERFVGTLPRGTPAAFIVPDSIFLPEHQPVRRMLASATRLLMVARLGEGLFPGVFRATAVLLFRAGPPPASHTVHCFRLPADTRRAVLAGGLTLRQAQLELSHPVPQARFVQHPRVEFNIDVRAEDMPIVQRFDSTTFPWREWLEIGRGIELGKSGRVLRCPRCGTARPFPRIAPVRCSGCRFLLADGDVVVESIIRRDSQGPVLGHWEPLIIGEDVDRYTVKPSRFIRRGVPGIKYKNDGAFPDGPKLLIRKTGVGLKAAIDITGAHTTQVVFHFMRKDGAPPFLLEYLEGVLCSRIMLALHLQRSGETEWRSHPYITPKTVLTFPIPHPRSEGTATWKQARAIADAVRRRPSTAEPDDDRDVFIDCLVAGLMQMNASECHWVLGVLDKAQGLEPIATLRLGDRSRLRPLTA